MLIARPMLCGRLKTLADVRFPCLATPKLDGVRCIKVAGLALTRSMKQVQNLHIRAWVEANLPDGADGELVVPGADFSEAQSAVMSVEGQPDFQFHAFDVAGPAPYAHRVVELMHLPKHPWLHALLPVHVDSVDSLLRFEEACLASGYEGIVVRSYAGPYKFGRSTVAEAYMLKWKRQHHGEALIVGFEEQRENQNPIVHNRFGKAKRPGGQDNKVGKGTLGSMQVQDVRTGVHFSIGTGKGLTAYLRQLVWDNRPSFLGRTVTYESQSVGTKDRPRFPSFTGFRLDAG